MPGLRRRVRRAGVTGTGGPGSDDPAHETGGSILGQAVTNGAVAAVFERMTGVPVAVRPRPSAAAGFLRLQGCEARAGVD